MSIHQSDDGVKVAYKNVKTGAMTEVTADYCVSCLPLTILSRLDVNLSPETMAAVKATPYSPSAKMGLQMKRRFWEEDDKIFGGHLYSNLPFGNFSYPSWGYFGNKGILLGFYGNGQMSGVVNMPIKDRIEHVLTHASKVHPQIRAEYETAYCTFWEKTPYSMGAFAGGGGGGAPTESAGRAQQTGQSDLYRMRGDQRQRRLAGRRRRRRVETGEAASRARDDHDANGCVDALNLRQEPTHAYEDLPRCLLVAAVGCIDACGGAVRQAHSKREGGHRLGVWVGDMLYMSGQLPTPITPADRAKGTPAVYGNTQAQAESTFSKIQNLLKEQGLGMGDVVMMRVYMAADPAMENKLDFAGMNAAYAKFFGTPEQPNKPARSTVQVAALVAAGALVEIEVQAARQQAAPHDEPAKVPRDRGHRDYRRPGGLGRRAGRETGGGGIRLYGRAGDRGPGRVRKALRLLPHAGSERQHGDSSACGRGVHRHMGHAQHQSCSTTPRKRCRMARHR